MANKQFLDWDGLETYHNMLKTLLPPTPTEEDNGKVLGVVNGKLTYVTVSGGTPLANVEEASFSG